MSTKINVRSPFYLSYSEPTEPSIALTCDLINLRNFSVDQYGYINLPQTSYGSILSYTSTDPDFSNGKFSAVLVPTTRTVTFRVSIPPEFSNASSNYIDCTISTTANPEATEQQQPVETCTGGITLNGSIPSQTLDTGGDTVTIDLSNYFTQGVDPIESYHIQNYYLDYFDHSLSGDLLTIVSKNKAGLNYLYVEASDGDPATCNATQVIDITTQTTINYTCSDTYFLGGSVAQDGTITNPSVNGVITAVKDTSGGTPITSLPANNTGATISHTLYFDITIPTGYGNTGSTIECSKTFSQYSSALPEFTCEVAGLTGQAITTTGIITTGIANLGEIARFSPLSWDAVNADSIRIVDYFVTPPASGYSNSGGSDIQCSITLTQPAPALTCGTAKWWLSPTTFSYMTVDQVASANPGASASYINSTGLSVEGNLNSYGVNSSAVIGSYCSEQLTLHSLTIENNINTPACFLHPPLTPILWTRSESTLGSYYRVSASQEFSAYAPSTLGYSYFLKIQQSGLITEIWRADWTTPYFIRIQ